MITSPRRFPMAGCLAIASLFSWPHATCSGGSTNRVVTIRIPEATQVVKAQRSSDGAIHVLFDSADGPKYAVSKDNAETFTTPITIIDEASRKPGLEFHSADLAVGKGGRVHVAMSNNAWKLKLPQEEWSLYYASLTAGAKTFSPVRNLNRTSSEGFSLAANERGDVAACFLKDKLFVMVSKDNGETFSESAQLNPAWDPCNCCTTSAVYGPDGKLAMIYREETNNERDIFLALWDPRGDAKPSRERISVTPWKVQACPMTYFAISMADSGYVAAWPTKGEVYAARLDRMGRVLPPGEIRTPGTSGMRTGVLALSAPDRSLLVAWKKKDVLGWQIYDASGLPQGKGGSAKSPGNGAAGVVLADGRFALFP